MAEGFSVFNAVLLELYSDLPGANELMHGCLNNLAANEQLNIVNSLKKYSYISFSLNFIFSSQLGNKSAMVQNIALDLTDKKALTKTKTTQNINEYMYCWVSNI